MVRGEDAQTIKSTENIITCAYFKDGRKEQVLQNEKSKMG